MKRQQIILIVCGILLAAVCAAAGWFLFDAVVAKNAAAGERDQAYGELHGIYQAKVFPNKENIARVTEDQKTLEAWLATASNLVHRGDLQVDKKTPTSFKQALQATVRELSAQPGTLQGKMVAPGFNFGFDQYLGQSDSLPASEHVDRLTAQLTVIEKICKELYAANVLSLKTVSREVFDSGKKGENEQQENRPKDRRRSDRDSGSPAAAKAAKTEASAYCSKQRFTFEFQARPAAFIDALNRLAQMELFTVVASVEVGKSADSLAAYNAKPSGAGATAKDGTKAVEVDLAKVPHGERIVTNPELEPPVDVKLDIDVYSFEGV
jgi:hypothetical protein